MSGWGGIIPSRFSDLLTRQAVALQAVKLYGFALFWQLAVISGCLGLLGIVFSTVSAQLLPALSASGSPTDKPAVPAITENEGGDGGRRGADGHGGDGKGGGGKGGRGRRPRHPGGGNRAASYARYSCDLQREESIADQRRKCRECAERNGHQLLAELEFADEAVSGTKLQRDGLAALVKAAADGAFDVLYFHSLSRLARESVITMPMLKELVYVRKIRVISVTEGLDSAREGWDMMATILSIQHERYVKDLSDNVFRGQEGNVLAGLSVGDYCFGYHSEPVPGSENRRRGRNAKPQKIYAINPDTAKWVLRIYHWFVVERRGLSWIARELNRLKAPKDHRAKTPHWRHQMLPALLRNLKYIGIWPWGQRKNVRNPLTGQVTQEHRPEHETEKWVRHLPHLQIIDNETFELAERYLRENEEKYNASRREDGQFDGSSHEAALAEPRHLLSGLLECADCKSGWYAGGSNGRYLLCTGHQKGICDCKTQLRRDRAERMILEAIGNQILVDPAWHADVLEATRAAWKHHQQTVPSELKAAEEALADVERKIIRLLNLIEQGSEDPDILQRLSNRRAERQSLLKDVERLKRANKSALPEPTDAWVADQLQNLSGVLSHAGPAAAHALRDLVGGKIFLKQVERPDSKRHFLRGRFTIRLSSVVTAATGRNVTLVARDGAGAMEAEFAIDFVEDDPMDALADKVKQLYDQGLMNQEIAEQLNIWRSQVTRYLKHWSKLHGEPLPDGRTRRASLPRKTMEVHQYERVAEEAVALMHKGFSDARIGKKLGCSAFVAGKAIRHWHRIRNLPTPTTRQRREARARLAKGLHDEGLEMKAIAKELECSLPTLCRLLDIAYELEGRERPDGRSLRASRQATPPNQPSDGSEAA